MELETTATTAKIFHVSKWWLYEHANEIPAAHRAGWNLRWDIEALKAWMRDQQKKKTKVD